MDKVCVACLRVGHLAHACPEKHWSYPKAQRVESEAYRRLVASFPCAHCGLGSASQAAHENAGKGKGIKAGDDRTFPLCHEGGNGCHAAFDQYRLIEGGRMAHIALGSQYVDKMQAMARRLARVDPAAAMAVKEALG